MKLSIFFVLIAISPSLQSQRLKGYEYYHNIINMNIIIDLDRNKDGNVDINANKNIDSAYAM